MSSPDPYDKPYPKLGASVIKFRKLAAQRPLTREERLAYGEAVEKAILALQRSEAITLCGLGPVNPKPICASGTFHNNGDDIHNAVLAQQRNALLCAPAQIRKRRSECEWRDLYKKAMKEKRNVAEEKKYVCPHGHEDSDDCPDCRH